jgi:hypothetical protein
MDEEEFDSSMLVSVSIPFGRPRQCTYVKTAVTR